MKVTNLKRLTISLVFACTGLFVLADLNADENVTEEILIQSSVDRTEIKDPIGSSVTTQINELNQLIDISDLDLSTPAASGITKIRDVAEGRFDIIILLDVIEHIANDVDFLQHNVQPKLAEGGIVLISVPAHPSLFSEHDEFLGHYRRYTRRQILDITNKVFAPRKNGYLFVSLALVRFLQRLLPQKGRGDHQGVGSWNSGRFLTRLVTLFLSIDALASIALRVLRIYLPGLTVWVSCTEKVVKAQ